MIAAMGVSKPIHQANFRFAEDVWNSPSIPEDWQNEGRGKGREREKKKK
jgi:hypothetical protein